MALTSLVTLRPFPVLTRSKEWVRSNGAQPTMPLHAGAHLVNALAGILLIVDVILIVMLTTIITTIIVIVDIPIFIVK